MTIQPDLAPTRTSSRLRRDGDVEISDVPRRPVGLKDLLRTSDLDGYDVERLIEAAAELKARPHRAHGQLAGEMVVLYLAAPSVRTRLSFSAAAARLGAFPVVVGPSGLPMGEGETVDDTARVVSGYAAALVVQTDADDDVALLARAATIPVVNGRTKGHHPCQSLADLLTLREHFGQLAGLRLAYLGAGNDVVHSLMEACALTGVDITVATPPGYEPDAAVVAEAQALAAAHGGAVRTIHDPAVAVDWVDAVYTAAWVSPDGSLAERQRRMAALQPYQVNAETMALAAPHAMFLHCLPAHRGDEVTADVIGGARSLAFRQADNRLHIAEAVLSALTRRALVGAAPARS